MTSLRWLGLAVALATLVADQVSKHVLLDLMARHPEGITITPFFNLAMVWNTGVSFGLFSEDSLGRRAVLIAVAAGILLWLVVWLWRAEGRLAAVALGFVIGGAIGNIIDRVRFGAVADFFDLHAFGWHWPAFNIADSAIVVGVCFLLIGSFFPRNE